MKSLGWVLIQHEWRPYKRTQTYTEKNMWRYREKTVRYKPKRGARNRSFPPNLRRNQPCWPLDLRPLPSRTVRKQISVSTQSVAPCYGSPTTLNTTADDFVSRFKQNPNTLPWRSYHLGPAYKRQRQSLPLSLPTEAQPHWPRCLATLIPAQPWLAHHLARGVLSTTTASPSHHYPLTLFFFLAPVGHSNYIFPSQCPSFPLASALRRWGPYLSSLLVPRTGLAIWVVQSVGRKTEYLHTHSFPLSLSHIPPHTHPPSVPVNSQ